MNSPGSAVKLTGNVTGMAIVGAIMSVVIGGTSCVPNTEKV